MKRDKKTTRQKKKNNADHNNAKTTTCMFFVDLHTNATDQRGLPLCVTLWTLQTQKLTRHFERKYDLFLY